MCVVYLREQPRQGIRLRHIVGVSLGLLAFPAVRWVLELTVWAAEKIN